MFGKFYSNRVNPHRIRIEGVVFHVPYLPCLLYTSGLNVDLIFRRKLQIEALGVVVHDHAGARHGGDAPARDGKIARHISGNVVDLPGLIQILEQPYDFDVRSQFVKLFGYVAGIVVVGGVIERAEDDQVVVHAPQQNGEAHDDVSVEAEEPVSYTHLEVYKRQALSIASRLAFVKLRCARKNGPHSAGIAPVRAV